MPDGVAHIDIGPRPAVEARVVADGPGAAGPLAGIDVVLKDGQIAATVSKEALIQIVNDRQVALTRLYGTVEKVASDLKDYFPTVPEVLPQHLSGQLLNPDGSPASRVSVEVEAPVYAPEEKITNAAWPTPQATTDARGGFTLALPQVPIPQAGLKLRIRGGDALTEIALKRADVSTGKLGLIPLPRPLAPLPESIIASLKDVVPAAAGAVDLNPADFADPVPQVTLGEGDCARFFRSNSGVIDRFGYSILVRLVEPQVNPKQLVIVQARDGKYVPTPMLSGSSTLDGTMTIPNIVDFMTGLGAWRFVDRVPVDHALDITDFRTKIENDPVRLPKAASLGLGYVVRMHQIWIPVGLSLGDLLYSMALAPGEQERIAVYEQVQQLSVQETESLSVDEAQRFNEAADSSTVALFNSSYREAASGGSSMHTESDTWSVGGAGGIGGFISGILFGVGVAGGYGSNSASGSSSNWQQGSRDYVSSATQDFHSRLARNAAASRRATRTGIRLATAADTEQVTTKVITNHNHGHALTLQYWEVLRHFAISTRVDDVQLVCFVPLDIVRFLPAGMPRTLPAGTYTRDQLLARYAMLLRNLDILMYHMQRQPQYTYGLTLLRNFASDPTATVQSSTAAVEDVISFTCTGTFLPFEEVYVSAVTKSGGRIGPIKMIGADSSIPADTLKTSGEVLEYLRGLRNSNTGQTRTADLVLPLYIGRGDVVRFEVTRRFSPFTYHLKIELPSILQLGFADFLQLQFQSDARFTPGNLESELGGPYVWDVRAALKGSTGTYADTLSGRPSAERMGSMLTIAALRVPPVLSFSDLLRIETVFQHVLGNEVTFSKAVWMSLTPEERAILLEPFTIGVPAGGFADASQEVPLLNCVGNEVLGYYGNAMIMPFQIPPQVAKDMKITSRDVQEALLKFHRQAFLPSQTSITLPTRGMLGEAVLGGCNSAEKIDLTRFWNWQDSASDTVAEILPSAIKGESLVGQQGVAGPSSLTAQGAPVNNLLTISTGQNAPAPSSGLLADLLKQVPQPTAITDITGATALGTDLGKTIDAATNAQKLAIEQSAILAKEVIDKLPDVMKASKGIDDATKKDQSDAAAATKTAQKDGIDRLSSNATAYTGVAGAQPDDAGAVAVATTIVTSILGKDLPGLADLAPLYDKFKSAAADDAATKRGKAAFLKALKLPN